MTSQAGWATVPTREWKDGDQIALKFTLGARLVRGEHGNAGRAAAAWGPFVLAYDQQRNAGLPSVRNVGLVDSQPLLTLKTDPQLSFKAKIVGRNGGEPLTATLTTFADAGTAAAFTAFGSAPGLPTVKDDSLLSDGEESRSRQGNVDGSINDGDPESFVVTFDGRPAKEDWFAVTLAAPVTIDRWCLPTARVFTTGAGSTRAPASRRFKLSARRMARGKPSAR